MGFEPTRPFDHRLSRPAPYQAWAIPPVLPLGYALCSGCLFGFSGMACFDLLSRENLSGVLFLDDSADDEEVVGDHVRHED